MAKRVAHETRVHGVRLRDEYHWLRSDDWPGPIADEDILAHLRDEEAHFRRWLAPLADVQRRLARELLGRVALTDRSTDVRVDGYDYYSRVEADREYRIYCRRRCDVAAAPEEVLLDVNRLAESEPFTSIGAFAMCPRHALLAYSVDHSGDEVCTIRVVDVARRVALPDAIPRTAGAVVWHEHAGGFFYTPLDEHLRRRTVRFHAIGTSVATDRVVFHEASALYSVSVGKTSSRQFVVIQVAGYDGNESHLVSMDDARLRPRRVEPRADDVFYTVDHATDALYMCTNRDAPRGRIVRAALPATDDGPFDWTECVATSARRDLLGFALTRQYLLVNCRVRGLPKVVVYDRTTGEARDVACAGASYAASGYSTNYALDDLRIDYSAPHHPDTTYRYDFRRDAVETLKVARIPSGFAPREYATTRLWARSGRARVPITVVYKRARFRPDGTSPLCLYAYGSYGLAVEPHFDSKAISLVDRGFVYAIAHVRGGGELGTAWHEAARRLRKKNTFRDLIAAADALIDRRYTARGRIVLVGASAGGLLVGAVLNERPELFKAAVAHVPFVDVLGTMLDPSLPLTPGEYKEWGDPRDPRALAYIRSYSPYENVRAQPYPHLLVTTGLTDPRVGYWEPAKWVARLRAAKTDDRLLLLRANAHAGHFGASSRTEAIAGHAEELVFILHAFGMLDDDGDGGARSPSEKRQTKKKQQ